MDESLFEGQNAAYVQAMFEEYARNPEAVPSEWRKLFDAKTLGTPLEAPSAPNTPAKDTGTTPTHSSARVSAPSEAAEHLRRVLPVVSRATALVQAFRDLSLIHI